MIWVNLTISGIVHGTVTGGGLKVKMVDESLTGNHSRSHQMNKDFWIPRVLITMSAGIALYALWIILLATGLISWTP